MSRTLHSTQTVSRSEAINLLRGVLAKLADEDSSVCKVAADKGIFCHGFQRYGDAELRRRFAWIDRRTGHPTRPALEDLANRWQLARQEVTQLPMACDVQQIERDTCGGWNDFSNDDLSRFCFELTNRSIEVG